MSEQEKTPSSQGQWGFDLRDSSLLFYDIECFKHNSLVVFKDVNNTEVAHFWCSTSCDFDSLAIKQLIKGKTLVGYNNYYYDDYMLTAFLRGLGQTFYKKNNDTLIAGGKCHLTKDKDIVSIDCFQQIAVSKPSLKLVEGNMGKNIFESAIPFDIDRELTDEERQETLEYCRYDVQQTIEVFKLRRKDYFEIKNELLLMLKNQKCRQFNTTTLSAQILLERPLPKWNRMYLLDKREEGPKIVPPEVWSLWMDFEREQTAPDNYKHHKNVEIQTMGCTYTFGSGGLHGVANEGHEFYDVKLLDVGSMYPSIIIALQTLGKATETYDQIRKERLAIKHVDKIKSNALKLVLNSVYGNLKSEYSMLYNPFASLSVCVYGQMALYELCQKLDKAGYQVVNANTDGVAFVNRDPEPDDWQPIQREWEKRWLLNLELDEFDWWYQKDVNNYIATQGDKVKVKGGETKKYPFNPQKGIHSFFANNDTRIIHIALVEYILGYHRGEHLSLCDIMLDHLDDPLLWQYVLKAGGTYKGVVDSEGHMMQKVNRVFAVRDGVPHTKLYKKRQDDGLVSFPDAPERMMIWNDDVEKFEDFSKVIDVNHYLSIARKKLQGWGFTAV